MREARNGPDFAASHPRSKAQQREHTMHTLVSAGRRQFASEGYAAVGLAALTREAGVTKGALYHHFGSKLGLFRVVVEEVQRDVGSRVAAAADEATDSWTGLERGCATFLTASSDPEVQRIMLIDAPAVLGWEEWRAMDDAASGRHLTEALSALMAEGTITPQPLEPLIHLLSGAMNEAALWLARAQSETALPDTIQTFTHLVRSLRLSQQPPELSGHPAQPTEE